MRFFSDKMKATAYIKLYKRQAYPMKNDDTNIKQHIIIDIPTGRKYYCDKDRKLYINN
jgi:hypothetical protein